MSSKQHPQTRQAITREIPHRIPLLAALGVALFLTAPGCAQENSSPGPAGGTGSGGASTGSGGAPTNSGTGGSAAQGSGGAPIGTGGASSATGGATASGSGGANLGTGGAPTTGGGGGTVVVGAACTSQAKGAACVTPTDSCSKTCGPKSAANVSTGTKAETCVAAAYVEGACAFPAADYTCFKVSSATAACPSGTTANGACTIDSCMPCSGYADSAGVAKAGFCHCVNSKWSCGSVKEWPCQATAVSTSPGGTGC